MLNLELWKEKILEDKPPLDLDILPMQNYERPIMVSFKLLICI